MSPTTGAWPRCPTGRPTTWSGPAPRRWEGAYAEAVRFFTALLEVDAPGGPPGSGRRHGPDAQAIRRARWEHQLGDAYLGLGQLAPEQEHLHAALALLGRRTPASGRRLPGKLAWQAGPAGPQPGLARPLVASSPETRPPSRRRPRSTSACSWSTTTPAGGSRRCTRRSRA